MAAAPTEALLLRWYQMSDRERLVWASAFSAFPGPSIGAAYAADEKVSALHALKIDDTYMSPEHELAKANLNVTYDDFAPWYRIAHLVTFFRGHPCQPPTEEDCTRAYERYQRSRCDFY